MAYNFDIKLKSDKGHKIEVDTTAFYGYWEWPNGHEGGGLWFELNTTAPDGSNRLELVDADGYWELPKAFVKLLRENGFVVGPEFD